MYKHSAFSSALFSQALIVCLLTVALSSAAQVNQSSLVDDRTRGIDLLQNGDAVGALKLLEAVTKKDKNDLVAWHWIGLAFERQAKPGDARKAHEKAARLGDALLMKQVDASGLDDSAVVISRLKPQIELAAESTDAYIKLSPRLSNSKAQEWSERREFLHDYGQFPQANGLTIYKGKDVTTKARGLAKIEPSYTEEARNQQVTGTVVLRAIFAEDGKVRSILPVVRLPYGLTASAIRAAREIRFIPATKDGRSVSMWVQLEYNFNLY